MPETSNSKLSGPKKAARGRSASAKSSTAARVPRLKAAAPRKRAATSDPSLLPEEPPQEVAAPPKVGRSAAKRNEESGRKAAAKKAAPAASSKQAAATSAKPVKKAASQSAAPKKAAARKTAAKAEATPEPVASEITPTAKAPRRRAVPKKAAKDVGSTSDLLTVRSTTRNEPEAPPDVADDKTAAQSTANDKAPADKVPADKTQGPATHTAEPARRKATPRKRRTSRNAGPLFDRSSEPEGGTTSPGVSQLASPAIAAEGLDQQPFGAETHSAPANEISAAPVQEPSLPDTQAPAAPVVDAASATVQEAPVSPPEVTVPEHTQAAPVDDAGTVTPRTDRDADPDAPASGADVQVVAEQAAIVPGGSDAAEHADAAPEPVETDTADASAADAKRTTFADLGLSAPVLRAIDEMGYRHPTPIQEQAIPYVLMTRDVLGVAQTGTGKTASFTLPMMDILAGSRARARMPRSLILEPTRELALQVADNFVQYGKYLKLTHALIIGGESMSDQKDLLMRGVDVLIATPGRLIDMFDRGSILLTDTRILVIDEADRMLDMGFIPDVERIVSLLPRTRQTLFFSATMGPEIKRLADAFLQNPREVTVSRPATVATTITEGLALVAEHDKREALRRLIRTQKVQNALIFCNRKRDVDILYKSLTRHQFSAGALHGDMAQSIRFTTLEKFKAGELQLLVCSDVAARGLDIGGLSHVFNFDVPHHAEDYVHRIGRTGRAGMEGHAFTIATPEDRFAVEAIEKLITHPINPVIVEGLDPVNWAEDDGRRQRGRGGQRKRNDGRNAGGRAGERDRDRPAHQGDRPRQDRGERPRQDRGERPAGEQDLRARQGSQGNAPQRDRNPRRDEPARDNRRDKSAGHDEQKRNFRRDDGRRGDPRRDDARRDDTRRDEPRRDRDDHRRGRRDEDLGPAVMGFGNDVPAFMLLRPRAPRPVQETETEA
jgi:superfamily II DNA/RNA helicase